MPPGGGSTTGPDARVRQPQLAKAFNRQPLTPKVAAKVAGPPLVSPLGRRSQNVQGSTPSQREDVTSTPSASTTQTSASFLHNITPRSGPRQNRVESANSTPSGTPNPDKTFEGWDNAKLNGLGVSTLSLEGSRQSLGSDGSSQDKDDSKFFYASDVKSPQPTQQQQRPASVPQKPTTFFYANGSSTDNAKRTTSPPGGPTFAPVLASTPEPTATKFFYANGAPDYDSRPAASTAPTTAPASVVSTSSRVPPSRPGTAQSSVSQGPSLAQRPMSPVKTASTSSVNSTLQGSPMPPVPLTRPPLSSPPTLAPLSNGGGEIKRRVSIEAPPKPGPARPKGHARTGSVPIFDSIIVTKNLNRSPHASEVASPPLSPGLTRPAMTMASILQAADELQDDDEDSLPEVHSPTKSVHSSDAISELVANARRERKVQDLEITNASLEAINRTLERQLRKQTAELRRYRRLSRSGRFSVMSAASSRVTSAAMSEVPVDLSDLSEEDDETEYQDSLHESDFSSDEAQSGDDPTSPSARMAARRKRDEIRLQLDLTKHQELLIDSQKINQSIKRCLDWTEVLIKEGQKALEYHVRVSDVELGGHVLAPPDEDEREEPTLRLDDNSPPVVDPSQSNGGLPSAEIEPSLDGDVLGDDSVIESAAKSP